MTEEPKRAPVQFPHYPPGQIHIPTVKEMGQMTKVLSSHLKRLPGKVPGKSRGKGLTSNQSVHIAKRKQKFY